MFRQCQKHPGNLTSRCVCICQQWKISKFPKWRARLIKLRRQSDNSEQVWKVNKFNIIEWISSIYDAFALNSSSHLSVFVWGLILKWVTDCYQRFQFVQNLQQCWSNLLPLFWSLEMAIFKDFHELKTWGLDQGHWVRLCFIQICIKCKYLSIQIFVYSMTKFLENSKSIFIGAQNLIRTTLKIGLEFYRCWQLVCHLEQRREMIS